ncbi:MAG: alpha/beta hydrolase [Betaproteobacteria bacterium]|nr:alpha/beta hydrolase [Betaproteobacteria bacterium]
MTIVKIGDATVEVEQTGGGPDLVLLHSLLTDSGAFGRVVPELAKHYRLTLVNLPGFGASTAAGATIEDYGDRIAAIFPALKLAPDATLFGNGFGGFVALAAAIRHGDRFGRLVIADSLVTFPAPAREPFRIMAAKVRESGMQAILDTAIRRMFPEPFIAAQPDIVAERKRALGKADPSCFAQACLALAQLDFGQQLKSIRNRTLVMTGELDQTTPAPLVRELAAAIPGAQFCEIAGSGHCPQIEKPAEFVAALRGFLD